MKQMKDVVRPTETVGNATTRIEEKVSSNEAPCRKRVDIMNTFNSTKKDSDRSFMDAFNANEHPTKK